MELTGARISPLDDRHTAADHPGRLVAERIELTAGSRAGLIEIVQVWDWGPPGAGDLIPSILRLKDFVLPRDRNRIRENIDLSNPRLLFSHDGAIPSRP